MTVHTYTLGCAIWTTLVGVRLHPLGLQCTFVICTAARYYHQQRVIVWVKTIQLYYVRLTLFE